MDKDKMLQNSLREILQFCRTTLDELDDYPIITVLRKQNDRFERAIGVVEECFSSAENLQDQDANDVGIRAATMFIIGIWSKLRHGVTVDDLTKDDWENIMGIVYEQATAIDPKDYSILVFDLYRKSIAYAIEPMRANASESVTNRLEEIVDLMATFTGDFESGAMTEVKYIEENLWLSLESVLLVMTDRMSHSLLSKERQEMAEAISALVFQKFRYSLYDKELKAINQCLEYQSKLDQRLAEQVNAYINALNSELDEFDVMVEKAFDTEDFHAAFCGSAVLAKAMGAEEILQTQQDVDEFFIS